MDQGAGVELHRKLGDPVRQGETLYAIYARFPADYRFARALAGQETGYAIAAPRNSHGHGSDWRIPVRGLGMHH